MREGIQRCRRDLKITEIIRVVVLLKRRHSIRGRRVESSRGTPHRSPKEFSDLLWIPGQDRDSPALKKRRNGTKVWRGTCRRARREETKSVIEGEKCSKGRVGILRRKKGKSGRCVLQQRGARYEGKEREKLVAQKNLVREKS